MSIIEQLFGVDERRRTRRMTHNHRHLELRVKGEKAQIINISGQGIRFIVGAHHKGSELELEITGNRWTQRLVARKIWSESVGPKHQVMGVQIMQAFEKVELARAS